MFKFLFSMVLEKFAKLFSKMNNRKSHHDHPQSEELSSSLHDFISYISILINQLALDLKPGSETLSLSWIERCFGLLFIINKAFAKLLLDLDYPMSRWEASSIEEYLRYSLSLVELLNSMSSSLSSLGQARLFLVHGLTLVENSPSLAAKYLKPIQPGCFRSNFGKDIPIEDDKIMIFPGKERVLHEAMKEIKMIEFWVCGVFLSGLCSDVKPYMEVRKSVGGFDGSLVMALDSIICDKLVEKRPILKEVKDLNNVVVDLLVASDEGRRDIGQELQTKLPVFEKLLNDTRKKVDDLFSNVMTLRSELIDCFRLKKQSQNSIILISNVKINSL